MNDNIRNRLPSPWHIERHGNRFHLVSANGEPFAEILPTSGDWTGEHTATLLRTAEPAEPALQKED